MVWLPSVPSLPGRIFFFIVIQVATKDVAFLLEDHMVKAGRRDKLTQH